MSSRRQFIGGGAAVAAASLSSAADAPPRGAARRAGLPVTSLFVYQPGNADAIEAGRVMAGRGLRVLRLEEAGSGTCAAIRELWARERVPVLGLTDEAGFRRVQALAAELGSSHAHSAPADRGALIHWVIDPV